MPRVSTRRPLFALGFLAVFLAVDAVTFLPEPPAVNMTPWNPPAGLYLALLLLEPRRGAAVTFVALMLGDALVRGAPAPWGLLVVANLLITAVYTAGAAALRGGAGLDPALDRLRDVVALVIAVPLIAALAALVFATAYVAAGLLPRPDLLAVGLQYWVGDMIGVLTIAPAALVLLHGTASAGPRTTWAETAAQALAVGAGLAVTFNPLVADPTNLFYVLFLPVIWVAMRRGLPGAAAAILATQVGTMLGLLWRQGHWDDVTYHQLLMVSLAATGLLVGAVVGERWRLELRLRQRQDELARVGRLSLLGEMASSLAHELNQPLFTTIGYTKAARQSLKGGDGAAATTADLMNRAVAEAERAAEVLRGIRGFLRQGERAAPMTLADSVEEVLTFAHPDLQRQGIAVRLGLPADLPPLQADKVQVEQVLLNLVRNSIDALAPTNAVAKAIDIAAARDGGMVTVRVGDNGPGVAEEQIAPLFDLFFTTKPSGTGLGLPISRSIVEAHGGKLWLARNGADGACFAFSLPAARP